MKCGHCQTDFHASECRNYLEFAEEPRVPSTLNEGARLTFYSITAVCSRCSGAHVEIILGSTGILSSGQEIPDQKIQVYPRGGKFPPAPPEVPAPVTADYSEANEVLPISPKAAAALARRCLQAILSAHGYTGRNLMNQVEGVLSETDSTKALPPALRENIDAIRNFGNFSAHPVTDQTTFQIIEVESGEAEWCLQILLDMFDHYYVAPARAAERRAELSAKLAAAGKPPMKN